MKKILLVLVALLLCSGAYAQEEPPVVVPELETGLMATIANVFDQYIIPALRSFIESAQDTVPVTFVDFGNGGDVSGGVMVPVLSLKEELNLNLNVGILTDDLDDFNGLAALTINVGDLFELLPFIDRELSIPVEVGPGMVGPDFGWGIVAGGVIRF